MARNRDPYQLAMASLRDRITAPGMTGGTPIVVMMEADRIGLSPTPVREALARLEGEGLVLRGARAGYRVASLEPAAIADGFAFQRILFALSAPGPVVAYMDARTDQPETLIADLMAHCVIASGNAAVTMAWADVARRLERAVRRLPAVLPDLQEEWWKLQAAVGEGGANLQIAVETCLSRRVAAAAKLSDGAFRTAHTVSGDGRVS